jgi:hypothetical protein
MDVRRAGRVLAVLVFACLAALAANFKLYLKDGSSHIVREYKVEADRVRYYSVERSEWEEIPLDLVDLKRTEAEVKDHQATIEKEAKIFTVEEQAERQQEAEVARVPQNPGVYMLEGKELRPLKMAVSKAVTNKGRTILKILTPLPVIVGETSVEIDGARASEVVASAEPEFYFRLAYDERSAIFKLTPKKDSRVVQKWIVEPVTNEITETQEEVPLFRRQVEDGLYKIWPREPLKPGEYAVVEYTAGQRNVQIWDFGYHPAGKP